MRWKQFFTPVKSLDAEAAKAFMADLPADGLTLLDVRQIGEYEAGHLPGAKLIPLPELAERLAEVDSRKPVVVYCAIGGRSRVAAQMMAGKGFDSVYNLAGGIKAWSGETAVGPPDAGLELFSGETSAERTLAVAYSLEEGLRDFYLSMVPRVGNPRVRDLFQRLADIEVKHRERIYETYRNLSKTPVDRQAFEAMAAGEAAEGGLTTSEYLDRFRPDLDAPGDVVGLAMSIEAQALDLYVRAAERSGAGERRRVLEEIAGEERGHLRSLGRLMDEIVRP